MNKDKQFLKMVVSKYSNRPPFDLKKPKENYDIKDKILEYPVEECKNCCKNRKHSIRYIQKPVKKVSNDLKDCSSMSQEKRVIPKILESFKKITPPQDSTNQNLTNNMSIETLYRNSKTCKLGKNIPKHKLMKSLLQNLDSEADSSKKNESIGKKEAACNRGRLRYKRGTKKKLFFNKDEVIRTDFDVDVHSKKETTLETTKVDKKTSTTGLLWPPKSQEILQFSTIHYGPNRLCVEHNKNDHNEFSSSSVVEGRSTNKMVDKMGAQKETKRYQSKKKSVAPNKTFVQLQVEKLNKVMASRGRTKSKASGDVCVNQKNTTKRFEAPSNYMGLMDRIRNKIPEFEEGSCSFESDHDWSDTTGTEISPEHIRFPKETQHAVDQRLNERKTRVPLSKFSMFHDSFKPALPVRVDQFGNIQHDGLCHMAEDHKQMQKIQPGYPKPKLSIPCKRNLLCDKGDMHRGPCGYSHNHNKVIF